MATVQKKRKQRLYYIKHRSLANHINERLVNIIPVVANAQRVFSVIMP